MARAAFQLLTLLLVALSAGMALCHLLEMPVRLHYPPDLWIRVTVTERTYRYFGLPIGAGIELGAWLGAAALAVLLRGAGRKFQLAALGAVLMVAAHAIWWAWVFPANTAMAGWTPDTVPAGFDAWRRQWELAHAVRAGVQILALGTLLASATTVAPPAQQGFAFPAGRRRA